MILAALAIAAQLADLATYRPEAEANGIVLGLGATAPYAKVALVVAVIALTVAAPRLVGRARWPWVGGLWRFLGRAVPALAVVVGLAGFVSNGGLA